MPAEAFHIAAPAMQATGRLAHPERATWEWFDRSEDVPWAAWDALPDSSAYLDRRYLEAMEGHSKVRWRLGLIREEGGPWLGGIVMQEVLTESRSPADHMDVSLGVRLATGLLHPGGRPLRFKTLVGGQSLGSGEHAFRWTAEVPSEWRVRWTERAFDECAALWGIRIWMAKDFGPQLEAEWAPHWSRRWARASFDPLMVVPLDPEWSTLDQWQEALRTKARTKVRSIISRNAELSLARVTDPEELLRLGPDLIALYELVYGRASIVMGGLDTDDFSRLATTHGDDFTLVTYHKDGRLVGFHCGLHHAATHTIEAYYVGFEPELNKECAIYQRMLIEFIEWGISTGAHRVVMGRTALEIKSTLGALPTPLSTWVHIRIPLAMPFLRWMIRKSPPHAFKPRRAWLAEWSARWESEGYRVD